LNLLKPFQQSTDINSPQPQLPRTPSFISRREVRTQDIMLSLQTFLDMFTSDIHTAHTFYNENILEDSGEYKQLELRVREQHWPMRRIGLNKAKKTLQNDMVNLYRRMEFLYSFLHVNRLAIKFFISKLVDLFPERLIAHRLENNSLFALLESEYASPQMFCDSALVKELMEQLENLYGVVFCSNDHHKALASLRAPKEHHSHADTFKFALNVGITLPVILMCIVLWFLDPVTSSIPVSIKYYYHLLLLDY
jgi:hypothetical protein